MVREITGGAASRGTLVSDNAGRAPEKASQPAPAAATAPAVNSDSVSISSGAQALKGLEAQLQKLPDVNEKRVAEIRTALASGQYKVDDLVIADKLLAADDLL